MKILVIDDDPEFLLSLEMRLAPFQHEVAYHRGGKKNVLKSIEVEDFDLAFIDMQMPEFDGFDVGRLIKKKHSSIVTVMLTSYPNIESIRKAFTKSHFDDYLPKQDILVKSKLSDVLDRGLKLSQERQALKQEYQLSQALREQSTQSLSHELVGQSDSMKWLRQYIERVAPLDSTILIRGETGTGKGLVAKEIHRLSSRKQGPFISINCGAIPKNLMESELFGHVKGAFTGALDHKTGLFTLANGGTLFLDEIGDMPLELQVKLLQVLQEKTIRAIGAKKSQQIDVRVLCATHQNLEKQVEQGDFREDLFYRLNVIPLQVPALRDRLEDLELLSLYIIGQKRNINPSIQGILPEASQYLQTQEWKGNIRELENVIERAMVWCPNEYLAPNDFANHSAKGIQRKASLPQYQMTVESDPYEGLWQEFVKNQYRLWTILDPKKVYEDLQATLQNAEYIKNGHFGRIKTPKEVQFELPLQYIDLQTRRLKKSEIRFIFFKEDKPETLECLQEDTITQPVLKGVPDSYIFNLLYPDKDTDSLSQLSAPHVARAIVLRYAQAHAEAHTLKKVFKHVMPCLLDSSLTKKIHGLEKTGLEFNRAHLCRKGYLFSGVSTKLKQDPDWIEEEVQKVFPHYYRPPKL